MKSKSGKHFVVPLIDWIPVSSTIQELVVPLYLVAAVLVVANVHVRAAAAVAVLCLSYILFSDWQALHHSSFLALNMFMLVIWLSSPVPQQRWAATWGMRVLAMAVYWFAGVHKAMGAGFRNGFVIEQLLDTTHIGRLARESIPGMIPFSVWSTIVLELGLPFGLLLARTRWWAVLIGLGFHIGMLKLTGRGSVFHFFLPITYIAFFMPSKLPRESQGSPTAASQ